ncbi:MAG: Rieske 2Fe-2S domain-containing protein [Acidobacteriaceae bacterium]|nr:Rieske 2Fe-2S domain-containing protein [Acidobacteriaceae bacterium]
MSATDVQITIGPLSLIPAGEGRNFEIAGLRIAVFHTRAGQVFAAQAECPHKNGPLADGLVGAGEVICPLHAWKFDLTTGAAVMGSCALKTYFASVNEHDEIVLALGSGEGGP